MPVLWNKIDAGFQQLAGGHSCNILSLQQHLASEGFIPPENSADQFCASRTDHTGYPQDLTRIQFERDIPETVSRKPLHFQYRLQIRVIHRNICVPAADMHFRVCGQ